METRVTVPRRCALKHSSSLLAGLSGLLLLTESALAREFYFSPDSLERTKGSQQLTDLTLFSNPAAQLPGDYPTQITVNRQKVQERTLTYSNNPEGRLVPHLTPAMLREWGVKVDNFPELAARPADEALDKNLGDYIPAASALFDFNRLTLQVSIPQASIDTVSAGAIAPSRWETGVPVMFADYAFSASENQGNNNGQDRSQYLNLRSGANLGGWRLRNYGVWSKNENNSSWQNIGSWVQHDLRFLKAQFVAGQSSTQGDVFDSIQFSGVNIASDNEMLPVSERGFAPVIRGTANSNAVVTVRQNGYVIYQQNLSPGPFEIRDLYASTNSGDLDVSVKESDGSEHHFTQAFSSVALMQRPSHLRFEATVGRYRADQGSQDDEPEFVQGSAIYGLNNLLTVYGGFTGSENYNALASGVGVSLGQFGAVSMDVTAARATLEDGTSSNGQSWRVMYSSELALTQTHFTLASYRYSTQGYYSFADANHHSTGEDDDISRDHKRSRLQLSINQPFPDGSLYLNAYQQNYWGKTHVERNISAGLDYRIQGINFHLALTESDTGSGDNDRVISFGFSVPLSRWLPNSWASYNLSNNSEGATTQNVGLNGMLLEDNSLSYSLQQSHSNQEPGDSSSVYANWRTQYASLNAGYAADSAGERQLSYGASGALVVHPHGVTLSQPLGDQFAIINADGASGIAFQNQRGIRTDWFGNAIIPSLSAYQENRIGMDTTQLPDNVDSTSTAITVVPSRNAAVAAHFSAKVGYRALIVLSLPNASEVPFGAMASSADGKINGIVAERGVLYLAGLNEAITISVKWGNGPRQHCNAQIPAAAVVADDNITGIKHITALCRQEG